MKYTRSSLVVACSAALAVGTAQAGGMAEPVETMDPEEIVTSTAAGTSEDLIIPLILLAFLTAALSSKGGVEE